MSLRMESSAQEAIARAGIASRFARNDWKYFCSSTYRNQSLLMNKIPATSQVSLSKGIWFIFRDGEREIAAHGSVLTGRERIFVNGELILQKRSFSKISEHQFIVDKNIYKVRFFVLQIFGGKMECSLIKDGKCIKAFKTSYRYKFFIVKILIGLLIGMTLGSLAVSFKFPLWLIFFVLLTLMIVEISRETKKIVIEEIDV